MIRFLLLGLLGLSSGLHAQNGYWQQRVRYSMDVEMNTETHQLQGKQRLVYINHSPDTLREVYYHLYWNAFQPGSGMDMRSRNLPDPDQRVANRIQALEEDEMGFQKVTNLQQDGKALSMQEEGTILRADLALPLLPGDSTVLSLDFTAQVPVQIRRSGRDNDEGIDYSMTQWYPKLCEYDHMGWHPNPYIGREFHGVWGDFDVKIAIDPAYTIGGTGILQNAEEVGHGYQAGLLDPDRPEGLLTWHFKAMKVHDFAWAADPDYAHFTARVPDGPEIHFIYQPGDRTESWKELPDYTVRAFQWMAEHVGAYPYKQYTVIQGGDGGMEYPMTTLITGERGLQSLVGVTVHEMVHSWFQGMLANNESLHPWMDEGFTTYTSGRITSEFFDYQAPFASSYSRYYGVVKSGIEEAMTTHSDHYGHNGAYSVGAYYKGVVFLHQLSYLLGQETLDRTIRRYFAAWKFKHPQPNDFIRIAEKESGMVLDWYYEYWIQSTKTIDYAVAGWAQDSDGRARVRLLRVGTLPMPLDVKVTLKNGNVEWYYIRLDLQRKGRPEYADRNESHLSQAWSWVDTQYEFTTAAPYWQIASVEIDPTGRLADVFRDNNRYERKTSDGKNGGE